MSSFGAGGVVPAMPASGLPLNQPVMTWPPRSHRGFIDAVAAGDYPVVPKRLTAVIEAAVTLGSWASAGEVGIGAYCDRTLADIRAGRAIPKDFAAAALQAEHDGNQQQAAQLAALIIRNRLIEGFPATVSSCAAEMLDGLRSQVAQALEAGRSSVRKLDGLDVTNVEAIAAGTDAQRKAFSAFAAARVDYERARVAQRGLLLATSQESRLLVGLPDNVGRHGLKEMFAAGVAGFSRGQECGIPADDLHPRERFELVLNRDDVWVPDLEDLGKAWGNCRMDVSTGSIVVSRVRPPQHDPTPSGLVRLSGVGRK